MVKQEQTQSADPDRIGPAVQLVLWLLVVYAGGSYVCNKLADPSYGSAFHSPLSFAGTYATFVLRAVLAGAQYVLVGAQ